jgi:predicted AAA+ superfamily ATPase
MIKRKIKKIIEKLLTNFPVVSIIGSRQVGKTTLAKDIQKNYKNSIYLDLELPSDLNKLEDPELYLKQYTDKLIVIDEIQRKPEMFSLLRSLVDQKRTNGRFLLLGSASPILMKHSAESLAGRIVYRELSPLSIFEIGTSDLLIKKLWLRGGYVNSFLAKSNKTSDEWRNSFIKTFLERDIPQLGYKISAIQLRRFLTMIAHGHGQLWNSSQIANSLGLSAPTIKHYLDIFEETFIVRQLQPYYVSIKKRLVKSPKVYIRDSGMLHSVLGLQDFNSLSSHPVIGNSWEGFVIEQILDLVSDTIWKPYFYRTSSGGEIDLILVNNKKIIAIEIKYSFSPRLTEGFWNSYIDLDCKKGFVIYPGEEKYDLKDGVAVLPMKMLSELTKHL